MNFLIRHLLAVLGFIVGVSLTWCALAYAGATWVPDWLPENSWTLYSTAYMVPLGFLLLVSRFLPPAERRPNIILSASALMGVLIFAFIIDLGLKEAQHQMRHLLTGAGVPVMLAMMTAAFLSPPRRSEGTGVE